MSDCVFVGLAWSLLLAVFGGCVVAPMPGESGAVADGSGKAEAKKSIEPWVFIEWTGNDSFRLMRRTKTAVRLGIQDFVELRARFRQGFTENYPREVGGRKQRGLLKAELTWKYHRTGRGYDEGVKEEIVYFSAGRSKKPPLDGYVTLEDYVQRWTPWYADDHKMNVVGHEFYDGNFELPEPPRSPMTMWVDGRDMGLTILGRQVIQDYDRKGEPLDHLDYPLDAYVAPEGHHRINWAIVKNFVKGTRAAEDLTRYLLDAERPWVRGLTNDAYYALHRDATASTPLEAEATARLFRAFGFYAALRYDPPPEGSWNDCYHTCLGHAVGRRGGEWTYLWGYKFGCSIVTLFECPPDRLKDWKRFDD